MRDIKVEQLFEGYKEDRSGVRFGEWVELARQADGGLICWLFGDEDPRNEFLSEAEMWEKYKVDFESFVDYCNSIN